MTMPLSGTYTYTYDKEKLLKTVSFPSGRQITMTYASGLLSATASPEGTTTYSYVCGRDVAGIARGSENLSYTYDGVLFTQDYPRRWFKLTGMCHWCMLLRNYGIKICIICRLRRRTRRDRLSQ